MNPTERLLERLEAVKPTGERRWQARCPAHDDRTPSLSVTEKTTGDLLVHCHAGCVKAGVLPRSISSPVTSSPSNVTTVASSRPRTTTSAITGSCSSRS